ncbi:hypothetical protein QR680_006132 [Steinernema hermaphroditum]|uniref:Uncharacterized protein n=1 Tax=Steinernema hermaphroditum TaxID=289476 RepID=A0AA39LWL7_9BILA|nr:hypothetical protein QR680_006132 [Steinernema hermaphroditum]
MYLVCSLLLLIVVVSPFPVVEIDEEGGEVVLRIPRSLAGVDVTVDSKVQADTATDVAADISGELDEEPDEEPEEEPEEESEEDDY